MVLDGEVGMALKAMEYWRCAETGLQAPPASTYDPTLKFVVAESLHGEQVARWRPNRAQGDALLC